MKPVTLVWFRLDLRLRDNPALWSALRRGIVIPVYVWSPEEDEDWRPGAASRWWLHQSLRALGEDLLRHGSRLVLRRGSAVSTLQELAKETRASGVFWNRRYEPATLRRDAEVESRLRAAGFLVEAFNSAQLNEPSSILNRSGKPFQVFTPYWKRSLELIGSVKCQPAASEISGPRRWPRSLDLEELELEPRHSWGDGLRAHWKPGEAGALERLREFTNRGRAGRYARDRDLPGVAGTSRLSPHLHFGEISPRQIWCEVRKDSTGKTRDEDPLHSRYLTELGWREFAHHLLFHFPDTPLEPLRPRFKKLRWRRDPESLRAWQKGETGYPIVDAGMRELWATGWMHNRVRMIVASFLSKDLLLPWQEGARWFWDTLVDADLAQNTLGWQWTAGCGADASPYFRVFNPISQGRKFDPEGAYVRRWCPELAGLPERWIHAPHQAPPGILRPARVELGRDYPLPIVNHIVARGRALEAYARTAEGA